MLGNLLALFLWTAVAAEPEAPPPAMAEVLEAIRLSNVGDRKGAIEHYNGALSLSPKNTDAVVGRGIQHFFLGQLGPAQEDLAAAFSTEVWKDVKRSTKNFTEVETSTTTLDLLEQRHVGAALLVVLHARQGQLDEGKEALDRARKLFGDVPVLLAAEARLALARGSRSAWPSLLPLLGQPDPTKLVTSIASEMAALDRDHAPPEVFAHLEAAGQWTAAYNQAAAQLSRRDYPAVIATTARALESYGEQRALLRVGYAAAARTDLAQADTWLDKLGGPASAPGASVVAHANERLEGGDPSAAVALLEAMGKPMLDTTSHRWRISVLIEAHTTAGQLDKALAWVDGTSAPQAETALAHALITKGRTQEAKTVLERACTSLEGQSAHQACVDLLTYASR
jgi:tetratricopeptide (TPR) repeat protein